MSKAKSCNKRIFIFVKINDQEDANLLGNGDGIIGEIKVKRKHNLSEIPQINGTVATMYSVFETVSIGSKCETLYESILESCKENKHTDFTKLGIYTSVGKNIGQNCLHSMARECNSRLKDALNGCKTGFRRVVNFLSADYPNFPGNLILRRKLCKF